MKRRASILAVTGIVAAAVLLTAAVAWYGVAATAPTGFDVLEAKAVVPHRSPTGGASAPMAAATAPAAFLPAAGRSTASNADDAEAARAELASQFERWWGRTGQGWAGVAEEIEEGTGTAPALQPLRHGTIFRALESAAGWTRHLRVSAAPEPPAEDVAATRRRTLDAFEGELLADERMSAVRSTDEGLLLAIMATAHALAERDKARFTALAVRLLGVYDPEEGLARGEINNGLGGSALLAECLRAMVFAACDEGMLDEQSLAAIADAAAQRRVPAERLDDLWIRYCVIAAERLREDARRLQVDKTSTWGCVFDGAPNRRLSSFLMPVYDRHVERLAVAWAEKDLAEIDRRTAEELAMRRRMNLRDDTARDFLRNDMRESIRAGLHPLSDVAGRHYNAEIVAIEARVAAERWRLARGGELPASLDDLVPSLMAPPVEDDPAYLWEVRIVSEPERDAQIVVVRCHSTATKLRNAPDPVLARLVTVWFGDAETFDRIAVSIFGPGTAP